MKKEPFNFNQGEEGLDDLFRRAAESDQPAMPPHAWLKMNQLLEADDQKRRRGFAWWWFPLLLFMAGHQHFVPEMGKIREEANSFTHATSKDSIESIVQPGSLNKEDEKTTLDSRDKVVAVNSFGSKPRQHTGGIPIKLPVSGIKCETENSSAARPDLTDLNYTAEIDKRKNFDMEQLEEINLYPALPKKIPLSHAARIQVADSAKPGQKIPAYKNVKHPASSTYRMYVYGSSGWDRGFINKNHASDYKTAYGGGIGWQLNERWAIQAGIYKTRKIYEAPGDAYTPKKGSYYDNPNYVIKEVYADCAILEIPLSVRYNVFKPGRHQLVGMVSIQNAVMERESYDYYYYRFGEPAKSYYTYRTKAVELFSGIGMSIGYEYRLSNRFHIQAMPYLSLPMKGIGEGSVKLRSAGIAAGLRYSFWKKN